MLAALSAKVYFCRTEKRNTAMKHYLKKLEETMRRCWDFPALCNFGGEQFSYRELATDIAKFHLLFEAAGVRKGDKIALCARNSARWAVAFLASNTYESVTVPILSDFLPESSARLVDHSGSVALFTDPDIWAKMDRSLMPALRFAVSMKDFSLLYSAAPEISEAFESLAAAFEKKYPMGFSRENVSYPDGNEADLAIINYTSGTTSAPKGVMLTYGNMSSTVEYSQQHVHNSPEDSMVSMLPLAHMYGLAIEFIYPCCSGCPVHFLGKTPSPTLLLRAMKEVRPYMVVTVPLVMEKVYKSALKPVVGKWYMKAILATPVLGKAVGRKISRKLIDAFGGRVRIFIMGGAALNPEVEKCFRRISLPYMVGYGMTEACPLLGWEWWEQYVPGSCGKPCHQVRIDSEDPQHIAGEIQAKGPNICIGYYKNEEANALAFTEDGWLRTGDLGVMDAEGNIFIKGRCKSMILSANGQNIYPEELEAVIGSQPYVAESLVVDRAGKIVALVYLDADAIKRDRLDEEAVADIPEKVRLAANRALPSYSQIAKVELMTAPFEKTPKMSIKRFLYK